MATHSASESLNLAASMIMQQGTEPAEAKLVLHFEGIPVILRRKIVKAVRELLSASGTIMSDRSQRTITLFRDGSMLDRDSGPLEQHEVPLYLPAPVDSQSEPSSPSTTVSPFTAEPSCWNCGKTGHRIGECPLPRDEDRIAAARPTRRDRYFLQSERQARFAHFKPGQLTAQLRAALGLAPGQLPEWVQRWQVFGPPPYTQRLANAALQQWNQTTEARRAMKRHDLQGDVEMEEDSDNVVDDSQTRSQISRQAASVSGTAPASTLDANEKSKWAELQQLLRR